MGSGNPQVVFVKLGDTAEAQSQESTLVTVVIDTSSFFLSIDFITYCISECFSYCFKTNLIPFCWEGEWNIKIHDKSRTTLITSHQSRVSPDATSPKRCGLCLQMLKRHSLAWCLPRPFCKVETTHVVKQSQERQPQT